MNSISTCYWINLIGRPTSRLLVYLPICRIVQVVIYLEVADDAEWFRPLQSTGRGGWQLVGSANQKVSCCRVTAALCAHVTELWEAEVILGPAHWHPTLLRTGKHLQSWEQRLLLWKSEPEVKHQPFLLEHKQSLKKNPWHNKDVNHRR